MKSTLTALIVDDEPPARLQLASLLAGFPEVSIVGEAGSVSEARKFMEETAPDLIFLDVRMPGGLGTELLPYLDKKTRIVFVTAYDSYAVSAFKAGALDYILKPVDAERLGITIERIAAVSPEAEETPGEVEPSGDPAPTLETIPYTAKSGEIELLPVGEILFVMGFNHYTQIRFKGRWGQGFLFRKTMSQWEAELPPHLFSRVSRSLIIQTGMIARIEWDSRDETMVHFKGGEAGQALAVGRVATAHIKEILKASTGSEG
jgi:two-component system LytT family response regulator